MLDLPYRNMPFVLVTVLFMKFLIENNVDKQFLIFKAAMNQTNLLVNNVFKQDFTWVSDAMNQSIILSLWEHFRSPNLITFKSVFVLINLVLYRFNEAYFINESFY